MKERLDENHPWVTDDDPKFEYDMSKILSSSISLFSKFELYLTVSLSLFVSEYMYFILSDIGV